MEAITEGPWGKKSPQDLPSLSSAEVGYTGDPVATPGIPKEDTTHVDPVKGDIMAPGEYPPKEVMSPKQPESSTELKAVLGILQTLTQQVDNLTKKNQDYSEQLGDL